MDQNWKLRILCSGFLAKGTYAWVESYDGGEDGEIFFVKNIYFPIVTAKTIKK